jgi:hypothetical protein
MSADPPALTAMSQYRLADYIHWFPAIEQQRMMDAWLAENTIGSWTHTGRVTADERTVITPQADVNYGYCWFNISNGPMVIELPPYERYSSLSIFDMTHFIPAVFVAPSKPIVIRLPNQASPIADEHDVVLETTSGLAFLRMVIPEPSDQPGVMELTTQIRSSGGDGVVPFIVPDFTDAEREAALAVITPYAMGLKTGNKVFGMRTQGIGDLDRCAGVLVGQLGIPAEYVQYVQYVTTEDGAALGGDGSYSITIDDEGLFRDDNGYWSVTIYNLEDRYLIPNPEDRYSITSYTAKPDADGTVTVRINRDGTGDNALPTMGKPIYAIMRVYQPNGTITFPPIALES